jgi:AcrR family transcriptional regulator
MLTFVELKLTLVQMPKSPPGPVANPLFFELFEAKATRGDLRKFEIIRSAIKVIGRDGIQKATFESIGKPLGIGKSLVAYHFESVEDVVRACVKYIIANVQRRTVDRVTRQEEWGGRAQAYVEAAFQWAADEPEQAAVYMLFHHLCAVSAEMSAIQLEIRKAGRRRLAAILAERRPGLRWQDEEELAGAIQGVATSKMIESITLRKAGATGRLRHEAIRAAFLLIDAADRGGDSDR